MSKFGMDNKILKGHHGDKACTILTVYLYDTIDYHISVWSLNTTYSVWVHQCSSVSPGKGKVSPGCTKNRGPRDTFWLKVAPGSANLNFTLDTTRSHLITQNYGKILNWEEDSSILRCGPLLDIELYGQTASWKWFQKFLNHCLFRRFMISNTMPKCG